MTDPAAQSAAGGLDPVIADEPDVRGEDCRAVCDPTRLEALMQLGLDAYADEEMDQFAEWVATDLRVPVALVSLVQADAQVFPGMVGLAEPWESERSTPLSLSFCRHVVRTASPLVITDARVHPLVRDNLAIPVLGVVAYAGMPLTDADGRVLGSLCAIDHSPRAWSDADLDTLGRIARACSTALRLRLAQYDTDRAIDHSQVLLLASQAFNRASTVEEVRACIHDLTTTEIGPDYVTTILQDEHGILRRIDDAGDADLAAPFELTDQIPSAVAIRENRIVYYPTQAAIAADYPPDFPAVLRRLGWHTVVAAPLSGPTGPIGALVFAWNAPDAIEPADLVTIASLTGYAGDAFARADSLSRRVAAARGLQHAMVADAGRLHPGGGFDSDVDRERAPGADRQQKRPFLRIRLPRQSTRA